MTSREQVPAEQSPTATPASPTMTGGVERAVFDPALRAAAVAAHAPLLAEVGEPVLAAGWWSAVVAPEDPRALELRHVPELPAADAVRVGELFAEVVDAGGACVGEAWEVLALWEMGDSPSAAAAANAVMILVCRAVEADEAAGHPGMPWWVTDSIPARVRDLLGDR